ncbi:ABC transporter permease [Modestobacter muralis]|uniref:ABC transporter permease n=1 Tax=Modestobacter muralis TaxID=1608614 RepID=A0A6P0EZX0_9ACTN|nr:ABC transporter permease [Modestobacter muralis]NEK95394.1 ABC transporter permease [Modestobacter muralis]NEN52282.1 ABC transporter permease [Modestobacter muralis]
MSTAVLETNPRRLTGPGTPPSLLRLTRVELRKSYDTRAGRWLLVAIALAAAATVALALFTGHDAMGLADHLELTQLSTSLLLPVLGILLVTSEWSQRTAMTTFTLVPRRSRVLSAKVLAASALALLGVVATLMTSVVAVVLTPLVTDGARDWSLGAAELGQVVLLQLVYVLSGVAFGMLLLSSPLAIVLYLVLPTVFTILVSTVGALDWVADWLDLTTASAPVFDGGLDAQGWLQLATATGLWLGLPMGLGWLRIERAEIS